MPATIDEQSDAISRRRGALSPWAAAIGLMFLLVAAFWLIRLMSPASPGLNAEAITTGVDLGSNAESLFLESFRRLEKIRVEAYETADLSLVPEFLAHESPLLEIVNREIARLDRENIRADVNFETEDLEVNELTDSRAVVTQTLVERVRFFDSDNVDVSTNQKAVRQVVQWELRRSDSGWRIFDSRLVDSN